MTSTKVCSTCHIEKGVEEFHKRAATKDGLQSKCKECAAKHFASPEGKARQRECWLKFKYGISSKDYEDLLDSQGGGCAICGSKDSRSKGVEYLSVDHCHSQGHVRGILCNYCNTALGKFQDSPEILQNAIDYLHKHNHIS